LHLALRLPPQLRGMTAVEADGQRVLAAAAASPLLARSQLDKGEAKPLGQRPRDLTHHRVAQVAVQLAQVAQARRKEISMPSHAR